MIPILTPVEMAAVDLAAPTPVQELIDRAGRAVARAAVEMMGGVYGRRVVIVAGPGNNGADGRVAARHLERRGVRCVVFDTADTIEALPEADLVIDSAFGTGLKRAYSFPDVARGTPVLAVDIPSGVDGLTGEAIGCPVPARSTITFAALKPGLLIEPGRSLAGHVEVVDIGLEVGRSSVHLVDAAAVSSWIPARRPVDHKWNSAVRIIAGSSAMTGAAHLAAGAAQRAGSGYVQLGTPGLHYDPAAPTEVVGLHLPETDWADAALEGLERFASALVGPGIGAGHSDDLAVFAGSSIPIVVDGDGLTATVLAALDGRSSPTVITPHDGEWRKLDGSTQADRISATRDFAKNHGLVVLRKGPSTIVAAPDGEVLVVANGSADLATAGTGDVLAGVVTALLARGVDAFHAAAAAAHIHAEAANLAGPGMTAADLIGLIPAAIPTASGRSMGCSVGRSVGRS